MRERRSNARISLNAQVQCRRKDGTEFVGIAKDISLGGIFIETSEPVAFEEPLKIRAQVPHMDTELLLPAIVRWRKPNGFGAQFGLLGARDTHNLVELIRGPNL